MMNIALHRASIYRMCWRAGAMPLFVVLLVLTFLSIPAAAQTYSVLYNFTGGTDGANPYASVIRDVAGNMYGTTAYGGGGFDKCDVFLCGVVFKVDENGQETVLHTFTGRADGARPYGGVIRDSVGNLYGTTFGGGDQACYAGQGCGVVFKISNTGRFNVLHTFHGADGRRPYGGVIRDSDGNLYGTTTEGGADIYGVVFKVSNTGRFTLLHRFHGADGAHPYAGLIRDTAGNLYGTTWEGGGSGCNGYGCGVVFKLSSTGKFTVLHRFHGTDGASPYASLIRDTAGNLFGTTVAGGAYYGYGVVFKLSSTGKFTVLHRFSGDGWYPFAGVIRDRDGNLYGTTEEGGSEPCDSGCGTIFKLSKANKLTVLHTFRRAEDGAYPYAGLVRDSDGNLYGTASAGGANGGGVVFKLTP